MQFGKRTKEERMLDELNLHLIKVGNSLSEEVNLINENIITLSKKNFILHQSEENNIIIWDLRKYPLVSTIIKYNSRRDF